MLVAKSYFVHVSFSEELSNLSM